MANYNFTFEEAIRYAELLGYEHRGEPSRAKDYTYTFWQTPHYDKLMVLYEGKKRILRGHNEPEVCWICLHQDGSVSSVPSRYFRKNYTQIQGIPLYQDGKQKMADVLRINNNII